MTTHHRDLDAAVHDADPIDTGRLAAAWSPSTVRRDLAADIVNRSTTSPVIAVPRHRRRTRTVLIAVAAALTAAALLLVGWSARQAQMTAPASSERTKVFTRGLPDNSVLCRILGHENTYFYVGDLRQPGDDLTPVDPAHDCAEAWRDTGVDPPELAAYRTSSGGIEVVPADRDVPASWQGYTYEPPTPAVLELHTSLIDYVDGLQSDCFDADGGRALVERELRRLGLNDWRITVRDVPTAAAARLTASATH